MDSKEIKNSEVVFNLLKIDESDILHPYGVNFYLADLLNYLNKFYSNMAYSEKLEKYFVILPNQLKDYKDDIQPLIINEAHFNQLSYDFIDWLEDNTTFICW
ncbi:hypothetical protein I5M32_11505 [Pedobacter sp. SD-b]|uniref:Uncharacterized protein n=1 Tax=Pedobacter segetis TaxID=2793069 RepID=A0ABS1BL17_9SPHI|nr:hypothetical protein [Pedobacter segetis]MBK0383584.1 hypothetical protein [Pedobacter segetis]